MRELFSELKRRNVFRVAIAYLLVAWVLLQIADVLFPALSLPDWTVRFVAGLLILGFPLALFFAWAFELTPDGLKREQEVDRSKSITGKTGRKLDRLVVVALLVVIGWVVVDRVFWHGESSPTSAADDKSIAVLPFVNMSDDPANEYFSDGVSEELLTLLARIPELRVIGRTSSFQYKDNREDLRTIGETLGVTNILDGSVRKSGNAVRITVQLVSAADGTHIWSSSYDRNLDDVFKVQGEIAGAVVDALRADLRRTPIWRSFTTCGIAPTLPPKRFETRSSSHRIMFGATFVTRSHCWLPETPRLRWAKRSSSAANSGDWPGLLRLTMRWGTPPSPTPLSRT